MDTAFFILSKLLWAFARPDHLLLVLLTLGFWLSRSPEREGRRQRSGRRLLGGSVLALWLVALYPLGDLLLYPLESRFPRPVLEGKTPVAGVIVLGGAERVAASHHWQSLEVNQHGERILALLSLLERYPDLPFIYTSGSGDPRHQAVRGADAVQRYLQAQGLAGRVRFERDSRNTYENVRFSRPLASDALSGPWLLVTSAFHQPRAVGIFRQQQWPVIAYPVGYQSRPPALENWGFDLSGNLRDLLSGSREWMGLIAYRATGKTATLLPEPYEVSYE